MNEDRNTKLVLDCFGSFQKGEIEKLLGMLTEDVTWEAVYGAGDRVPTGGVRRGRNGVRDFFRQLGETVEIKSFDVRETIAQNDKVVALGHYTIRDKATGNRMNLDWVMVFEVKDGKVKSFREFTDTAAILEAHGVNAAVPLRREASTEARKAH